jgi:hypothetical protein
MIWASYRYWRLTPRLPITKEKKLWLPTDKG